MFQLMVKNALQDQLLLAKISYLIKGSFIWIFNPKIVDLLYFKYNIYCQTAKNKLMIVLTRQGQIELQSKGRNAQNLQSQKKYEPASTSFQKRQFSLDKNSKNSKLIPSEFQQQDMGMEIEKQIKNYKWTSIQESTLYRLHNEKGNRWIQIARILNRTDNSVKNYFYSKMRKALRIINQLACKPKNEVKPINYNIISKILQRPQQIQTRTNREEKLQSINSYNLKNRILKCLQFQGKILTGEQQSQVYQLVKDLHRYNQAIRRRNNYFSQSLKKKIIYKGKEILNLITENQMKKENLKKQLQKGILEKQLSHPDQKNAKQMLCVTQEKKELDIELHPIIHCSNFDQYYFNGYSNFAITIISSCQSGNQLNFASQLPFNPHTFKPTFCFYDNFVNIGNGNTLNVPLFSIYPINT